MVQKKAPELYGEKRLRFTTAIKNVNLQVPIVNCGMILLNSTRYLMSSGSVIYLCELSFGPNCCPSRN